MTYADGSTDTNDVSVDVIAAAIGGLAPEENVERALDAVRKLSLRAR